MHPDCSRSSDSRGTKRRRGYHREESGMGTALKVVPRPGECREREKKNFVSRKILVVQRILRLTIRHNFEKREDLGTRSIAEKDAQGDYIAFYSFAGSTVSQS